MPAARGTFIVKALAGSPADKGDMKAGDVVLNVGKTNIVQFSDVPKAIASHSPGEKVLIGRWRKSDRGIRYRDSYARYARSQKTFRTQRTNTGWPWVCYHSQRQRRGNREGEAKLTSRAKIF